MEVQEAMEKYLDGVWTLEEMDEIDSRRKDAASSIVQEELDYPKDHVEKMLSRSDGQAQQLTEKFYSHASGEEDRLNLVNELAELRYLSSQIDEDNDPSLQKNYLEVYPNPEEKVYLQALDAKDRRKRVRVEGKNKFKPQDLEEFDPKKVTVQMKIPPTKVKMRYDTLSSPDKVDKRDKVVQDRTEKVREKTSKKCSIQLEDGQVYIEDYASGLSPDIDLPPKLTVETYKFSEDFEKVLDILDI